MNVYCWWLDDNVAENIKSYSEKEKALFCLILKLVGNNMVPHSLSVWPAGILLCNWLELLPTTNFILLLVRNV